jgi:hypothetical protein
MLVEPLFCSVDAHSALKERLQAPRSAWPWFLTAAFEQKVNHQSAVGMHNLTAPGKNNTRTPTDR